MGPLRIISSSEFPENTRARFLPNRRDCKNCSKLKRMTNLVFSCLVFVFAKKKSDEKGEIFTKRYQNFPNSVKK